MILTNAIRTIAAGASSAWAGAALSHDGHRTASAHWHASDAWGLVLLMALAATTVWMSRGK
jgi:hypothetical protein